MISATSIGGGVALDPEGVVTSLPLGNQLWKRIGGAFGESNATAILPGAAIAAAAAGESATAFALGGLAVATTDINIPTFWPLPPFKIPTGQASCIGLLAYANSSTNGSCLNVLGTFDADYRKDSNEISIALTNPAALVGLINGDMDVDDILRAVLAGQPISRIVTDDFARLTFGGPEFIKATSDYAFQEYGNSGGAIVVEWLGGTLILLPVIEGGLLDGNVNYLGRPSFDFAGLPEFDKVSDLLPTLKVGAFKTPFPGITIPEWSTGNILDPTTPASASLQLNADQAAKSGRTAEAPVVADPADLAPAAPAAPAVELPATSGPATSAPVGPASSAAPSDPAPSLGGTPAAELLPTS